MLFPSAQALQSFSGQVISIDSPINDDIFAAGNIVNINAPVNSAVVAGGTLNINAPVKGDVFVAGGQVTINSDIGGKVVTAGGNVNLGGNIGTNLVAAGGSVDILPGKAIGRDALISAGNVINAGKISGNLTVYASNFRNNGSAGRVEFHRTEAEGVRPRGGFNFFGVLMAIGYFILGLIMLRYIPGIFADLDREIKTSTAVRTIIGFVAIIVSIIVIFIIAITVVGLPIAVIMGLLFIASLMLTGIFVSFSLGRWIGGRMNLKYSDMGLFVIGFVILNILFLLPYIGGLIGLISLSLGYGAILYAVRDFMPRGAKSSVPPALPPT
ncbi:MAG: hypothetical protein ACE14P_03405 [Methanotrichaceae archaeon]